MATTTKQDYRLGGDAEQRAIAAGLAEADWYRAPIDPARLQQLAQRSNGPAALHVGLYLTLLVGSGVLAYLSLWSWWTIPLLFVYGTLYGSSADPRWHECGHRTAFRSDLLNDLVYYPASFMLLRDPTVWRWSHVRHHSDTIVVGRDPEVILERPPQLGEWLTGFFSLKSGPLAMARTARHALGRIGPDVRSYVPEREIPKVVWEARAFVAIWLGLVVWCLVIGSALPLLFFVGPAFYGAWLVHAFGTTQHLGLQENVLDHRLNTRTIYLNPVLRFLYWNMNYHCEHHMYPTVPSRALAELHEEIRDQLPEPTPSFVAAYREVIPALRRQSVDPTWELDREIPGLDDDTPGADGAASAADQTASAGERLLAVSPAAEDGWLDVCAVGELSDGEVARADAEACSLAVYCLGSEYFASDGICTHSRRVHLAGGVVVDGQIECPKHNGRFDIRTGEPSRAPVSQAVATHEVRVVGERVWVRPNPEASA